MENHLIRTEDKLTLFMKHAPYGLAEIDSNGNIIHINSRGKELLKSIGDAKNANKDNLYPVLEKIAPSIIERIKNSDDGNESILANELHSFSITVGEETEEKYFNLTVHKVFTDCIIVSFDDITEKHLNDKSLQQCMQANAIALGRLEILSNVLHDIGNAVVGFGSYLTRIKRSLEMDNAENVEKLVGFFQAHKADFAMTIGDAKADAIIQILSGIAQTQKTNQVDIGKSITEQHNIINHIQEILNIQRHYATGYKEQEKKPTRLNDIINDCLSMLFASFNKRSISVMSSIPDDLPMIKADRTRLMQVILNILKNGTESIDLYAVEKTISVSVSKKPGLIILEIKDSGKGFDEETGENLFTRGFTTKSTGTGIGLHSCKVILEDHDATISITSEGPGKGALVTLTFKAC